MAKKRSKKRRPPPRRPAAAKAAGAGEGDEAERPSSRRAERKEEARKERERRIRQARRRQRNRRLIRWGVAAVIVALIGAFVVRQVQEGERRAAEAASAAERLGCTEVEEQPDLGSDHTPPFVEGTGGVPATSGSHTNALRPEPKVYTQPVPEAQAVHNLEHGYVLVYYAADGENALDQDAVSALESLVRDETEVIMAPYEGLSSSLALAAWRTLQTCTPEGEADADDVETVAQAFIDEWKNSGRAPEAAAA